jgi:beta-galactosidase
MKILTGVDYYPEHWTPEMCKKDISEMKKAGVDVVRIGEFSWSLLEPCDGQFDFLSLDNVINLLSKSKIQIILGIPTCCPPRWLFNKHQDIKIVGRDGLPTPIGIRGHRCLNSINFRKYAFRLADKMLERYSANRSIIGWQIDNELETNFCMCDECAKLFRDYCQHKYGTLENLNLSWGTDVWSGTYRSWNEITPPLGKDFSPGWFNPGYMLDFERFADGSTKQFMDEMCKRVKTYAPNTIVTSNACFSAHTPNYHKFFENADVASYDNYPPVRIPDDKSIYSNAFNLDMIRGYKEKNFWIMEQLSGPKGCWCPISPTPLPGMINGYAMQAVAHGANMILFFRWRTAYKGAEMFWHGLFETEEPSGRRFSEFLRFNNDLKKLGDISDTQLKSEVAVIFDIEQNRALDLQQQSEKFDYFEQCKTFYSAFSSHGINVNVIASSQNIDKYKIIAVPSFFIGKSEFAEKLEKFVKHGGTVIIGCRSGVKDKTNARILSPLPGVFSAICGCTVSEYDPIGDHSVGLITNGGKRFESSIWCDLLKCNTAKVYASYESNVFYDGTTAVTVNNFGDGKAWYIGTVIGKELWEILSEQILSDNNIKFYKKLPHGVEITTRENNENNYCFIFNNSDLSQEICFNNKIRLAPFEMAVFKKANMFGSEYVRII